MPGHSTAAMRQPPLPYSFETARVRDLRQDAAAFIGDSTVRG
jgi:hypothetical protein